MTDLGKVVGEYMAAMHFDPYKNDETLQKAGANNQTRSTHKQQHEFKQGIRHMQQQQSQIIANNNQTMTIQHTQPTVCDLDEEDASDLDEDDSNGELAFA